MSGAGQHVAGIGGSETIIAINTDRTSPLLKMADLGVVGDLHEIVPLLIRKLRERAKATDARYRAARRSSRMAAQSSRGRRPADETRIEAVTGHRLSASREHAA